VSPQTRRLSFIAFEGPEGSGKSTQAARLARDLAGDGHVATLTREPGSTPLGQTLRSLLLAHPGKDALPPVAELLLFLADRNLHVEQVISPRLHDGHIVITDRFSLSTLVYQGVVRGLPVDKLIDLNDMATYGLVPDLTIVLDVDARVGLDRVAAQRGVLDRIEREPLEFHERVRQGFLVHAHRLGPAVIIDGHRDPDEVAKDVRHIVNQKLLNKATGTAKPVPVRPDLVAAFNAAVAAVGCPRCGSTRPCRCLVPAHERVDKVAVGLAAVLSLIGAGA
jgi:dTMP kinase